MFRAGISLDDFGKLTMKKINYIANAYSEKLQEDFRKSDMIAFVQGRYVVDALLCTVGNMLGGKNSKFTYPEQAYSVNTQEIELTEDEKEAQRKQFVAALQTMQRNFNLNKQKKQKQLEDTIDGKY